MDLNTQMQQAVVHAVSNLLGTMVPMNFEPGQHQEPGLRFVGDHLLGMIQVNGKLSGSITISVPSPLALAMTAAMLEEEESEELNDDVYETIAEITNIIAGGVKTFLCQQEEMFNLGLPQVLELRGGRQLPEDQHRTVVPIQTDKGKFIVMSTLFESAEDEHAN